MSKEERRAEKIRALVQSGKLFADAAQALAEAEGLPVERALMCVLVAEVTHEIQHVSRELAAAVDLLEERK
jgi:hypothetical protein